MYKPTKKDVLKIGVVSIAVIFSAQGIIKTVSDVNGMIDRFAVSRVTRGHLMQPAVVTQTVPVVTTADLQTLLK